MNSQILTGLGLSKGKSVRSKIQFNGVVAVAVSLSILTFAVLPNALLTFLGSLRLFESPDQNLWSYFAIVALFAGASGFGGIMGGWIAQRLSPTGALRHALAGACLAATFTALMGSAGDHKAIEAIENRIAVLELAEQAAEVRQSAEALEAAVLNRAIHPEQRAVLELIREAMANVEKKLIETHPESVTVDPKGELRKSISAIDRQILELTDDLSEFGIEVPMQSQTSKASQIADVEIRRMRFVENSATHFTIGCCLGIIAGAIIGILIGNRQHLERRSWTYTTLDHQRIPVELPIESILGRRCWQIMGFGFVPLGYILSLVSALFQPAAAFSLGTAMGTILQSAAVSMICLAISRQFNVTGADSLLASGDRPIVYLRPFSSDGERPLVSFFRAIWNWFVVFSPPIEARLREILRQHGPVIAIGRPGDQLPPEGAARIYVNDEHWQQVVMDLLRRSQFVIMRGGGGDGLKWELESCLSTLWPEQFALVLPYSHSLRDRGKPYAEFRNWAESLFESGIPEKIGGCSFICFQSEPRWSPVLISRDSECSLHHVSRVAADAARRFPLAPFPRWWAVVNGASILIGIVALWQAFK